MRRDGKKIADRRVLGIAAVEMAIVLPIVLLLLMPVGEFGRAFIQYSRLSHRVLAGARFVADNAYADSSGVASLSSTIGAQARNLVVFGSTAGGSTPAVPGLSTSQVVIQVEPAGTVRVSIVYPYQSVVGGVLPMFGFGGDLLTGALVLRPRAVMRAL
jgi:Flp pilus assembly protein TadG